MRFPLTVCAAFLAVSSLAVPVAQAQKSDATSAATPAPPKLTLPLAIAPEKGLTVTAAKDEAVWDFGERTAKAPLEHIFTIRNTGTTALHLTSLLTSCRCTTASFVVPGKKPGAIVESGVDSYTLEPGKSVGVRAVIDPGIAHAVDFRKLIWVYLKGRDDAALTLTLAGKLAAGPGDVGD